MFVGHYSAALLLRSLKHSPPLPVLFAAVQLMDILFFPFVMTGLEAARIVPGMTVMNPMDLHHMPYSHGLTGVFVQSALFAIAVAIFFGAGNRMMAGLIASMAVFSHWMLDVITHRPDMILFRGDGKIGAGLWNHPAAAMSVEAAIVIAALILYANLVPRKADQSHLPLFVLAAMMALSQCINWFAPQPQAGDSILALSTLALVTYAIFIALAWWVEKGRVRENS